MFSVIGESILMINIKQKNDLENGVRNARLLVKQKNLTASLILINGAQARLPLRWSWKEGWEISMFLISVLPT